MDWPQTAQYIFYGLLSGAAYLAVYTMNGFKDSLENLKDSVIELNKNVATVIEKTAWHEKVLDRHEEELNNLRNK